MQDEKFLSDDPEPIKIDPAVASSARIWLTDASTGAIDRTRLDPQIRDAWSDEVAARWKELLSPLGEVVSFYPFQTVSGAHATQHFFRVEYNAAKMTWVFSLSPFGEINGFSLRRSWRSRLASIMAWDIVGY